MRQFAAVLMLSSLAFSGIAMAQSSPAPPAPPPGAPGDCMPPGPPAGPGGWKHGQQMMQKAQAKFNAANTTHDGHLTLAQAQAAKLKPVVDNFSAIDVQKRGYVTFNEVEAWRLDDMAQHMEQQAAQLRAQN